MADDSDRADSRGGFRVTHSEPTLLRDVGLGVRYVVVGAAFALAVLSVTALGSVSLAALLFPLVIVASGLLLDARRALYSGVLSAILYVGIAFAQEQGGPPFARPAGGQSFVMQAVAGTLALAASGAVVHAGVRRWEQARHRNVYRGRRLQAAAEIGLVAFSAADLDEMLGQVVDLICERFDVQHAQVFLLDGERAFAVLWASGGEAGQADLDNRQRYEVGGQGVIGEVTAGAGPIVVLKSDVDGGRQRDEWLPDMRSELVMPMAVGDRLIGALDMQSAREDAFAEDDIAALTQVADQLAVAVDNLRALASEAGVLEKASPAFLAGRELAAATDIRQVLNTVRQRVVEDVDRLSVVRLDTDRTGRVHPVTLAVWDRDDLAPFGVNFEDLGLDLASEWPRVVEDVAALSEPGEARLKDVLLRLRARTFAAFPLVAPNGGNGLTGFLLLFRRAGNGHSEEEIHTLQTLSNQIALVVNNLKMAEVMQQQSERLGLLNEMSRSMAGMPWLDLEVAGREVASRIARWLTYEHLSLTLLDGDRHTAALHFLGDDQEKTGNRVFPLDGTAILAVVETRQTMITLDLSGSPYKDHQAWWAEDVFGAIVMPLQSRGKVLGTLNIGFPAEVTPSTDDAVVLEQLATQLALVLDNQRLAEAESQRWEMVDTSQSPDVADAPETTRHSSAREQVLGDIAARLRQAPDVESVLRVAAEELGKALDVQEVSVQIDSLGENGDRARGVGGEGVTRG